MTYLWILKKISIKIKILEGITSESWLIRSESVKLNFVILLQKFRLIDTAGIRRRASVASSGSTTEALSVNRAFRAVRRSDVVALVIEALACITEQVVQSYRENFIYLYLLLLSSFCGSSLVYLFKKIVSLCSFPAGWVRMHLTTCTDPLWIGVKTRANQPWTDAPPRPET